LPTLIATDEAGYGPKLGPLVVVATVWEVPRADQVETAFTLLQTPIPDSRCNAVFVDDSKRVFKRNELPGSGKISMLDIVCSAAAQWCELPDPSTSFTHWLEAIAKTDFETLDSPWFMPWKNHRSPSEADKNNYALNRNLIEHWSSTGLSLRAVKARFITAAAFNRQIDQGKNKADVLTEATCLMIGEAISSVDDHEILIFSDRHGGRAYYGAPIQHVCADMIMNVVSEGPAISRYRLTTSDASVPGRSIDWSFSVGGDSFAPVAMSSMVAKWLRERAMFCFNQYFMEKMPLGQMLKPTAGYPTDANRFLIDIENAGLRQTIDDQMLIRKR
jgi:ribonuclease HII